MRVILIVLFFLCILAPVYSQSSGTLSPAIPDDDTISANYEYEPDREAKEAVYKIVKYTGLTPNFIIVQGNVSTALAYIKGGDRYIAYNPEFIHRIRSRTKTDWGAVSVLAHEIGHHLSGHTLKNKGSNPGDELAADKFSGFILFQMGASLEETKSALKSVGSEMDSVLHPPQSARLEVITNGWLEAQKLSKTPAYSGQQDTVTITETAIRFVYKCHFKGDPNIYFVDDRDQIIWFDNAGKPVVIGTRTESTSPNYKWNYNYTDISYGVDAKGNIWSETPYGTYICGNAEKINPTGQ
jgi:hypothetical protein